jgi:hypothetical protein
MTKSRRRPVLFLAALIGPAFPATAQVPSTPGAIVAAPPDPLGDLVRRRYLDEARCRDGDSDAIVVCGRIVLGGGGYRIPYRPEPGARVRLIAGEVPSGMSAMGAPGCLRLCYQPVMINLLDPGSIVRGLDRILSRN